MRRSVPEINAGSMADIAFLLLIFFLVATTIESNTGVPARLPQKIENDTPPPPIKEKNIFEVLVNKNNDLLVENKLMDVKDLRQATIDFLDNGGGLDYEQCTYCKGKKDPESSDNPKKAVISLTNDRETSYERYITVQNELTAAYNFLRDREAKRLFPDEESYVEMEEDYNDPKTPETRKQILKEKIKQIQELFPRNLTEPEPKNY